MRTVYLLMAVACLAGCTNQQVYTAIQDSQKVECQKYPDTRYEECMAELGEPYEEYESDRRELEGD